MSCQDRSQPRAIELLQLDELPRPFAAASATGLNRERDQVLGVHHTNRHSLVRQIPGADDGLFDQGIVCRKKLYRPRDRAQA